MRTATINAALLLSFATPLVQAYDYEEFAALKWPGARTTVHAGLPNRAASGETYLQAIIDAATQWTVNTPFRFDVSPQYRDPCASAPGYPPGRDGFNGQGFATTVCGDAFNGSTLAVTLQYWEPNVLGTLDMVEADVVYNANSSFDIYDGPLTQGNGAFAGIDFRRTALHELGHVLGLGHENRAPAIMAPSIGDLFRLQSDDIAGARALYRGISGCPVRTGRFGRFDDSLDSLDCRINTLLSGGTDNSPVDVYTFTLDEALTVDLRVTAASLDSVLMLASPGLEVLALDTDSDGGCNPRIRRSLPAGDYVVLVNTWTGTPPCGEAVRGDYRLTISHESDRLLRLTGRESFQGGRADAQFFGAVTVNGGQQYRSRVTSDQPFDVDGRIIVDPVHRGQPGFLVVAAITGGETLVKNGEGAFVTYRPAVQLVPIAERRVLSATEDIDVMTDVVAEAIGIDEIDVDFFIGYGVDANPDELYFHRQPINLIVE